MKMHHISFFIFWGLSCVSLIVGKNQNQSATLQSGPMVWPVEERATKIEQDYIDITADRSNLTEIIDEICLWDTDSNSLLWQFKRYFNEGNVVASKDAVIETLIYAENFLEKSGNTIPQDQLTKINNWLDNISYELRNGNLSPDSCSCSLSPDKIIKVRNKLYVFDRAKFFDCVTFKGCVEFEECLEDVCVDNLTVNNCMDELCVREFSAVDASVSGTLSINEAIIETLSTCDVIVGCNIIMNDSITPLVGNIIKNGQLFMTTFPAGSENTFLGENAGNFGMTATQNVGVGFRALENISSGTFNVAVGDQALNSITSGFRNVAVGTFALNANTTGTTNTAVGDFALDLATGDGNTALGTSAMLDTTTGIWNTALGAFAMQNTTTGSFNTAVGRTAMINNNTGSNNVAVGQNSFASGSFNVMVGSDSGNNGEQNVGVGYGSCVALNSNQNAAVGYQSMGSSSSVNGNNSALGYRALRNVQGSFNIGIGTNAGLNSTLGTSNNNIYIDNIGANESGRIRIGTLGTHVACFIQGISGATTGLAGVAVLVDANGQLGTISSSQQFKHAIEDMNDNSAAVLNLRPVTFVYNNDESETVQYGLIAEEVDQVFPALVAKDADGNSYAVQYHILPVLLLNELIKQHKIIELQSSVIDDMNNRLLVLENHN